MTPNEFKVVHSCFLKLQPLTPQQRKQELEFLDENLRNEVASLLASHDSCGDFLEPDCDNGEDGDGDKSSVSQLSDRAVVDSESPTKSVTSPGIETAPRTIGQYRLLQKIGEGGHGSVFMAEQQGQLRRKVAVKLIKPGMDSKQVLARFHAEQQALAMMDHSSIAKVFDAGVTESGSPYFVMELVKGIPIHQFCEQSDLSLDERLRLFLQTCDAVHHAHRRGVIHRDIKPSNVLVTMSEDEPIAKVIDFGIAKALDQRLTEQTLFTEYGQMIGTLEYMSPEQAEMSAVDVDTRSDVYSLGVLLYRLLTGETPISREALLKNGVFEIPRLLRETEPKTPSDRITARQQQLTQVDRDSPPEGLSSLPSGELDWIALKALEKDRRRRYDSVLDFARDIRRFVQGEPVEAHPPSMTYRLGKSLRRHWVAFSMVAILTAGFLFGSFGLAVGFQQARKAEANAKAERQAAEESRQELAETVYSELIDSAWRAANQQKDARARVLLDQTLPKMRGWEWSLVNSQIRNSTALKGRDADAASIKRMDAHEGTKQVVCVLQNGTVEVWRLDTGIRVTKLALPERANVARWSTKGDTLFVGTGSGMIHTVRAADWSISATYSQRRGGIYDICVAPTADVTSLAVCTGGGWIESFTSPSPNEQLDKQREWKLSARIASLGFDPQRNDWLGAGYDGKIYVCSNDSDAPKEFTMSPSSIHAVSRLENGDFVAMTNNAALRLDEKSTGTETLIKSNSGATTFTSDGHAMIAMGGGDGNLVILDVGKSDEPRIVAKYGSAINDMTWMPQRRQFLVSLADGRVHWAKPSQRQRAGATATAGLVLSKHSQLVTFSDDGKVTSVDLDTGATLSEVEGHQSHVWSVATDSNQSFLASVGEDQRLRVWDLPDFRLRYSKPIAWGVRDVCVAPDGSWVASAPPPEAEGPSQEGTVSIRDAKTGNVTMTLTGHQNWVLKMATSPDGAVLATSGENTNTRIWNVKSGRQLQKLEYESRPAAPQVSFDHQGETLYLGHRDGWISAWDSVNGSHSRSRQAFGDGITGLAVTADDRVVAISSSSEELRVYDFVRGRRLASLDAGIGLLQRMQLSRSNDQLSLVGDDRSVTVIQLGNQSETTAK